jgi:hypothetical protein
MRLNVCRSLFIKRKGISMLKLKFTATGILLLLLLAGFHGIAWADNVDTQVITFEVQAINELELDPSPAALVINSATAGQAPNPVTQVSAYDITTNCATNSKRITAVLSGAMPSGVTLELNPAPPTGAVGGTYVPLTAVAANIVTGVDAVNEDSIAMTYRLSATVGAGVVASDTRTVTVTLSDN